MRLSLAVLLLANLFAQLTLPATAEPINPEFVAAIGRQGYGRCHMDECGFFVIDASAPVGTNRNGTLFAISYRAWEASYRPTDDEHEYDRKPISASKQENRISFVFCSKTEPANFDFSDGKWSETPLRPGDDDAVFGVNEFSYTFYYAACHGYITKSANLPSDLAEKLGYHLHGGFPGGAIQGTDRQPFDMLR